MATIEPEASDAARAFAVANVDRFVDDDVGGFENFGGALTGGIMATGNYPGKARTHDNSVENRSHFAWALLSRCVVGNHDSCRLLCRSTKLIEISSFSAGARGFANKAREMHLVPRLAY